MLMLQHLKGSCHLIKPQIGNYRKRKKETQPRLYPCDYFQEHITFFFLLVFNPLIEEPVLCLFPLLAQSLQRARHSENSCGINEYLDFLYLKFEPDRNLRSEMAKWQNGSPGAETGLHMCSLWPEYWF